MVVNHAYVDDYKGRQLFNNKHKNSNVNATGVEKVAMDSRCQDVE